MATIKIITLGKMQNPSLQIGDFAFYQVRSNVTSLMQTANNPIYIGQIIGLGENYIDVESSLDPADISGFLMYSKSKVINNSSLNGYYAEVTFRNSDVNNQAEIFAINSEVSQSSK
tara:strand:- start:34 stop:381 length:348 start_codon:yes stop_codon:yes gene_type:complete